MQRQWGQVHEIYEGLSASRFDHGDIPTFIRDPDSTFSAVWDLSQVFLLLYVAVTVPMRAGATTPDHSSPSSWTPGCLARDQRWVLTTWPFCCCRV